MHCTDAVPAVPAVPGSFQAAAIPHPPGPLPPGPPQISLSTLTWTSHLMAGKLMSLGRTFKVAVNPTPSQHLRRKAGSPNFPRPLTQLGPGMPSWRSTLDSIVGFSWDGVLCREYGRSGLRSITVLCCGRYLFIYSTDVSMYRFPLRSCCTATAAPCQYRLATQLRRRGCAGACGRNRPPDRPDCCPRSIPHNRGGYVTGAGGFSEKLPFP